MCASFGPSMALKTPGNPPPTCSINWSAGRPGLLLQTPYCLSGRGLLIAVQAELASLCASLELFLAANAYTDNCGLAPILVGKMEASWMFRLAMW